MTTQRVVLKIGTSTLTSGTKRISMPRLVEIAAAVFAIHKEGHQVILVSSGAIAAGREALNYPELPKFIPAKQMLAAVGQPRLMGLYENTFGIYDLPVAQVLLTRADLTNRRRFLNARSTIEALLDQNVIPIINENDTVATEEIRFGDNDNLSAHVANLTEADVLILLTDQEGLFTEDPRTNPEAQLVKMIDEHDIPDQIWQAAGGTSTGLGTGGMVTKVQAADLARRGGTTVVIASGTQPSNALRILQGDELGTWFCPIVNKLEARKRYVLAGKTQRGKVVIDAGAERALRKGSSLLAVGVIQVEGSFDRGDSVLVRDQNGKDLAIGLSNYASADVETLIGKRSSEIEACLGYSYGDEMIHRNNMVLL